ncbi:hypothetical protein ACHAXS_007058 [Conticribra weissflogii]
MLSGIKRGKRKRPTTASASAVAATAPPATETRPLSAANNLDAHGSGDGARANAASSSPTDAAAAADDDNVPRSNRSAAEALRQSLLRGDDDPPPSSSSSSSADVSSLARLELERRGRIVASGLDDDRATTTTTTTIVLPRCPPFPPPPDDDGDDDRNLSVSELLRRERRAPATHADDDLPDVSCHVSRRGRSRQSLADRLARRNASRQLAIHLGMEKYTKRSYWWVESPSFQARYLISLGEKVSLVVVPSHRTLAWEDERPSPCRIVPLSHCESFASLDDGIAWDEVTRFRRSLRQMCRRCGMGVLFLETVCGTGKANGVSLQAKMEAVPVPTWVERDASMYFKSALAEAAQEWGVHGQRPIALTDEDMGCGDGGKCIPTEPINTTTTKKKTLRNAVPKGFPYFYVGWEGGGYVQLIESDDGGGDDDHDNHEDGGKGGSIGLGGMGLGSGGSGQGGSNAFWRDFGMDTIAGMMGLDPLRFGRRPPARDGDKRKISEFCEWWKEFDWTLELD